MFVVVQDPGEKKVNSSLAWVLLARKKSDFLTREFLAARRTDLTSHHTPNTFVAIQMPKLSEDLSITQADTKFVTGICGSVRFATKKTYYEPVLFSLRCKRERAF